MAGVWVARDFTSSKYFVHISIILFLPREEGADIILNDHGAGFIKHLRWQ